MAEQQQPATAESVTLSKNDKGQLVNDKGEIFVSQKAADEAFNRRFGEVKAETEAKFKTQLETANTELETLRRSGADVDTSNKILKESYDGLLKLIPDDRRAFIPAFGTMRERLEYINSNRETLFPKPAALGAHAAALPVVPNANGEPITPPVAQTKTPLPAQYASPAEFQQRDPKGYLAYIKTNAGGTS